MLDSYSVLDPSAAFKVDMLLCQHCWHTRGPDLDRPERPPANCHCHPTFAAESRRSAEEREASLNAFVTTRRCQGVGVPGRRAA